MRARARLRAATVALAALVVLLMAGTAAFANVWTDRNDYQPGDTVLINGDGMTADEGVGVDVSFPDGSLAQHDDVQADDQGNFSDTYLMPSDAPGGIYSVTATGASSGNTYSTTFDPNGNGALDCPLTVHNPTHYKLQVGTTVTCTIDGASEVSGQSTTDVIIKSSDQGNTTVTGTVTGTGSSTQITFSWTAPYSGCNTTIVAYQTEGLNSNNRVISGGHSAAGFAYTDAEGNVISDCRGASIGITKLADASSVSQGDNIGFTITVTSNGPADALDVALDDPLPTGGELDWSIDGGTGAGLCSIVAEDLQCSFGTMASGASFDVHVSSATTDETKGLITNTAYATATNAPPVQATATVFVNCTTLRMTMVADNATVTHGNTIGFTITIKAQHGGIAREVAMTSTLAAKRGLSWSIDTANSAAGCSISGSTMTCALGDLASGSSLSVHVTSPTRSAVGKVKNTASCWTEYSYSIWKTSATVTVV
jgi:uncharacterized repeat protein (TIGR01451 family)